MKRQNNDMDFGTVPVVVPPELRRPGFQDLSAMSTEKLEEIVRKDLKASQDGLEGLGETVVLQVLEELRRRKTQPEGRAAAAWESFLKHYAPASMKAEGGH